MIRLEGKHKRKSREPESPHFLSLTHLCTFCFLSTQNSSRKSKASGLDWLNGRWSWLGLPGIFLGSMWIGRHPRAAFPHLLLKEPKGCWWCWIPAYQGGHHGWIWAVLHLRQQDQSLETCPSPVMLTVPLANKERERKSKMEPSEQDWVMDKTEPSEQDWVMEPTEFTLLGVCCSTSSRMEMWVAGEISNWTLKVVSLCMSECSVYIGHHTTIIFKGDAVL